MLDFWRLPAFRVCLAALAVGLMLLGPLLVYAPLEVTGLSTLLPVQVVVLFMGFALASIMLLVRYRHDTSRPALAFKWGASRMFDFMAANLFLMVYTAVAVPLCYLTFSLAFPMQDAAYAAFDRAIGFDFNWWVSFANDNPAIGQLLIWSYASFVGQLFVVILLLSLWGCTRELWEFMTFLTLGSLVTIIVSGLFPAIAPYAFYATDPAAFATLDQLSPGVGRLHVANVLALHSGELKVLDVAGNHGLVTFPSYHAVLALSLAYALRCWRYLAWPAIILNGLMLIATLPIGGHYLADIYGGLAIFLGIVAVLDYLNGRASMWSHAKRRCIAAMAVAEGVWGQTTATRPQA